MKSLVSFGAIIIIIQGGLGLISNSAFRKSCKSYLFCNNPINLDSSATNRKILNSITGAFIIFASSVSYNPQNVRASSEILSVIGSNGKTGRLIVDVVKKMRDENKLMIRPIQRSADSNSEYLKENGNNRIESIRYADVTKVESLSQALQDSSEVIFAASASSKGGKAKDVDYLGVKNVASECIKLKIPKLVIISSGAVTKPDSFAYKFTNLFGGIMEYKFKGENALKELYKTANDPSLSYVIIRPGGLLDDEPAGASQIEINQGDTISGEISRSDLAECAVAVAQSKTIPAKVIFEVYKKDKSGPLQPEFTKPSGLEQVGKSYDEMFKGLKSESI